MLMFPPLSSLPIAEKGKQLERMADILELALLDGPVYGGYMAQKMQESHGFNPDDTARVVSYAISRGGVVMSDKGCLHLLGYGESS